ncbi:MAG: cyclopropane-fatty-acyl-phospholipid synthase family protein [Gammaproteobacteria bacterium]|uniref:SAM-dependent methyltransferase n=1 Tax=Hydrogenophaga sp. TaxID=1904254 RepID=UPI0008CAB2FD|nr:cyclopropane-fatty-acyl-phospholipid synthase family protein [Hydrogenophaga sp.]MBU4181474.1 cyclopropane-fatty-acyl-phospholipid synthase family protein [Gammaproteobacteria bacterium]OGB36425.1 MAG: cyclopropane-fatty-acyl-phospholipid synthase [Burkholderiales bacterium RIFCSPLOWO2_02_FULL_66_35]MBU4282267.1 cyclopropane-fatty-acyl-phospholipid synthase family protein [Gammaproteobacteria bacterium]MBU4323468.1 cyclopropane-fatty-acyl-phospholipid synthase family protein [Gammaproteobact
MNSTTAPNAGFALPRNAPAAARSTLQLLQRLRHGSLTLQLPDGSVQRFGHGEGIHASLSLHNWKVFGAALKSGDIGFAESYLAGDWHTPNLTDLLRLFIANRRDIEDVIYGSWFGRLAYWIKHKLNRNSRTNSRKNIHAHYDLGNAFYELWLDGTMNYSSALFETPEQDMVAAQHAKVRRALNMAGVQSGHRVLEIGCGWGALAEMATTEFGAALTGVTLSTEQLAFAQQRLERLGTSSRADLRLQDYRDINDGPYDAICSIEMVEAVGREYWPTYFQSVARLLKPGGRACIQSIVIADDHFDRYIQGTDFIQQYIFPGGCLPCPSAFRAEAQRAGLEVVDQFAFGPDYARTLQIWRDAFLHQQQRVLQLGFDQRFLRIWEFYLAYCEAAFAEGNVDVVQFTLRKPA